jgi:4-hydroxy-4-methyl-2-oxoglutarate aldolase
VIGDGDGVVIVERDRIESLLPLAAKKVADEVARIAEIKRGYTASPWVNAALVAPGMFKPGQKLHG